MKILGIETSCDETAIAIIESDSEKNITTLSNIINSQIDIHKNYGGVFPTLAKREHAKNIVPVLIEALEKAGLLEFTENKSEQSNPSLIQENFKDYFIYEPELLLTFQKLREIKKPDIDLISVTEGPGLEPALWVGINFARALSKLWQIPLIPINHMEGHIVSVLNSNLKIETPAISLLISGGHTELIFIKELGNYEIIGQTKDDAVGEAFDKVARMLDLEYPGGPKISKLAENARLKKLENFIQDKKTGEIIEIKLPRPMLDSPDFNFSFSGLKTASLYLIKKLKEKNILNEEVKEMLAREFEDATSEVLFKKTKKAIEKYQVKNLIIGGGVIANKTIRTKLKQLEQDNIKVLLPNNESITDNGLMIAIAGLYKYEKHPIEIDTQITAKGNLKLS
jgi:N6-L-threonylcarbamoyladenine synthase